VNLIELRGVSKTYPIFERPSDRLKELLTFGRRRYHRDHQALQDISLEIRRGETFCLIGENGSGKSTLLEIMAGILPPAAGAVHVRGRVTALLELGSGFNPEFTGRQNVFLNGAILGLSKAEIAGRLETILDFAEIRSYIDQPIKTYSTGMVMRLAFAVAVHLDPDIFLVDEALAVGDIYFRQRSMRKIHELRARGVTIVFASHEISDVNALGERTLWLRKGRVEQIGETGEVTARYLAALIEKDAAYVRRQERGSGPARPPSAPPQLARGLPAGLRRYGNGCAEIIGLSVVDEQGRELESIRTPSRIVVRVSARARDLVRLPILGIELRNAGGIEVSGTNTAREGFELAPLRPGDACTADFHLSLPELAPSKFTFSAGVADGTLLDYEMCDKVEDAVAVEVTAGGRVYGYLSIPCGPVRFRRARAADLLRS